MFAEEVNIMFENFEDDFSKFGINLGSLGIGILGPYRVVKYDRAENTHIIRIDINAKVQKEQIKVRLVKPGLLEIEWPRIKSESQEISVQ